MTLTLFTDDSERRRRIGRRDVYTSSTPIRWCRRGRSRRTGADCDPASAPPATTPPIHRHRCCSRRRRDCARAEVFRITEFELRPEDRSGLSRHDAAVLADRFNEIARDGTATRRRRREHAQPRLSSTANRCEPSYATPARRPRLSPGRWHRCDSSALLSSLALLGAATVLLTRVSGNASCGCDCSKGQSPWSLGSACRPGCRRRSDRRNPRRWSVGSAGRSPLRSGVGVRGGRCALSHRVRTASDRSWRSSSSPSLRRHDRRDFVDGRSRPPIVGPVRSVGADPGCGGRCIVRPPRSHRRNPADRRQGGPLRLLGAMLSAVGDHRSPRRAGTADRRAASSMAPCRQADATFGHDRAQTIAWQSPA